MRKSCVALLLLLVCGVRIAEAATVEHIQMWSSKPTPCSEAISNRPAPVTTFRPTDSEAYLWFVLRGGAAGDIVASEYYTPAGDYYEPASGPWPPNEAAGDYCFTDLPFAIAGAPPATMPGLWTVRVSANGIAIAEIQFTITAGGGGSGPLPVISQGGVVNAADYTAAVAAGGMMSIFGSELAPGITLAKAVPLPLELAGVKVEVVDRGMSKWAALFFIAPGQINAQMPFGLESATVQVRVWRDGQASTAVAVAVAAYAPRLFTKNASGQGEAILLHSADWTVVNEGNPAVPGEYVILYLTGLGEVSPNAATGAPGGDNAENGPVNYCQGAMSVTIGGQNTNVVFAGLAPGFVGLYQMNLQVPPGLQSGRHPVVVRSGAATSQGNVHLYVGRSATAPEDVVKSALEAQARGDVEGVLALTTTGEDPPDIRQRTREMADFVASKVSFSDFRFTLLARSLSEDGNAALVRSRVSYTQTSARGSAAITRGILTVLVKRSGQWKVTDFIPDQFVDQQVHEETNQRSNTGIRRASLVDVTVLNDAINKALNNGYFDYEKWAISSANAVVGKMGPWGNVAAQIYQVLDTVKNVGEAGIEWWKYGSSSAILKLKLKQAGVGLTQILSEYFETADWMADAWQTYLEQVTYNQTILRDLREVQSALEGLKDNRLKINPRLYPPDTGITDYPAGIEFFAEPPAVVQQHSYQTPLTRIDITAPPALDGVLPLQVVGEFPVPDALKGSAKLLGGKELNGVLYLPVDVSYLVREWSSEWESVLEGPSDMQAPGALRDGHVLFRVTCRRGAQLLSVKLASGEETAPLRVQTFMDLVYELLLDGIDPAGVEVGVGESRSFRVTGRTNDEQRFWPDLTGRGECLQMDTLDREVATIVRGKPETLAGVKTGETTLKFLLSGGMDKPPLEKDVPVKVGSSQPSEFDTFKYVSLTAEGEHVFRETPSGETRYSRKQTLGSAYGIPISRVHKPLTWSGNSFSQSVTEAVDANMNVEYRVSGQLNGASKLQSITIYQRIEIKENTSMYGYPYKSTRVSQITATNLDRVGQAGLYFRFDGCNTGQHVAITDNLVSDFKYPGKEWQQETEKYERTNWCNPAQLQGFDPGVSVAFDENTWTITPPR